MLLKTLTFLLGIILFLHLRVEMHLYVLLILLTVALCFIKINIMRLMIVFLLGLIWANLNIVQIETHLIPAQLQNTALIVQGKISSLVKSSGELHSFYIEANTAQLQGKLKLSAYHLTLPLQAGQTWQLVVKLKRPWGFANPGGFYYQDYLWMQHVIATGYVVDSAQNHLLKPAAWSFLTVRAWLAQQIDRYGGENRRFIQALAVGDRDEFTEQDWRVLQQTGTNHLVAISGLHIGLMAGLVFFCAQFLWRRSRVLCLLMPASIVGAFVAMMIACFYSGLAGFSLPTQRAVIMLVVFMMSVMLKRSLASWHAFSLALLLVLLLNPLSVLDSGFWLSFAAVAALIVGCHRRTQSFVNRWLLPQCIVILGVAPWTIFYFHQFSLISPLANLITIPMVGFVIVPLCLVSCLCFCLHVTSVAILLLKLAEQSVDVVWWILRELSHWSFANVMIGYFPLWKLLLASVVIVVLLSQLRWLCKLLSLLLLPFLCLKPANVPLGDFQLTLLDVGQGLASVVETAHHVLVFDTGPKFSDEFNAGSAVVVPFLQSHGMNTVDKLVVSHGDNDHIGGAAAILNMLTVLSLSTSVPQRFQQASYCLAGQRWQWDGVNFEFLYPDKLHLGLDNNSSCVLKVSNMFHSALLTGDIEKSAEDYLVAHQRVQLKSSILIAPHHGSKTSSSELFLEVVQPRYVFFPVGYLNRFHFPNAVVVRRYQQLQVNALATDRCGAISVLVGAGQSLAPVCYRQELPFYLHY